MYINWSQFLMQCLALTGWIFLVAAVYAIVEPIIRGRAGDKAEGQNPAGGEGRSGG